SIIKVLSAAYSEDRFYYNARAGWLDLAELRDCVVTTGDLFGLFSHPSWQKRIAGLRRLLHPSVDLFAEVCPVDSPLWATANRRAIETAATVDYSLPLVVGYPALYGEPDDADSLDVLRVIATNQKMG